MPSADQKHGIDLVIVYGKFAVRIATFMGTERGRNWRREKLKRADCDGYFVELPLSERFVRTVGEYKLYGPWHVEAIRSTLPSMVRTSSARWAVVPKATARRVDRGRLDRVGRLALLIETPSRLPPRCPSNSCSTRRISRPQVAGCHGCRGTRDRMDRRSCMPQDRGVREVEGATRTRCRW